MKISTSVPAISLWISGLGKMQMGPINLHLAKVMERKAIHLYLFKGI